MLALMPELGYCNDKEIASLAGLAPINRESGKWTGKSFISGGRKSVRKALYMPALSASRFNPILQKKYNELIQKGKPAKLALSAIMRKLLVAINALIHKHIQSKLPIEA